MLKKGQVSIYIIIGLILILAIGITIYQYTSVKKEVITKEIPTPEGLDQLSKSCLKEIGTRIIETVSVNGGEYNIPSALRYYHLRFRYFVTLEGFSRKNVLILRKDIENNIANETLKELKDCINLNYLKEEGYTIEEKNQPSLKVNINTEDVLFTLNYPIKISKDSNSWEYTEFNEKVNSPLGKLYDLAIKITNEELKNGYFNKDKWMQDHSAEINIVKYKPYPNTIYLLSKQDLFDKDKRWYFLFALEGYDHRPTITVKKPSSNFGITCYTDDKNCYFNSDVTECILKGGRLEGKDCSGLSNYNPASNNLLSCNYSNKIYNSGQSWCNYEGPAGGGMDRPGSRHTLFSCINGRVFTEPCADYREEICGYYNNTAACRENRWQDCTLQSTKENCQNKDLRDCSWKEWIVNTKDAPSPKCLPEVPIGKSKRSLLYEDICDLGNDMGFGPVHEMFMPPKWVSYSAMYCSRMGDCGAGYNYLGVYTNDGVWNTQKGASNNKNFDPSLFGVPKGDYGNISTKFNTTENNNVVEIVPKLRSEQLTNFMDDFAGIIAGWIALDDHFCGLFECKKYGGTFGEYWPKMPLKDSFYRFNAGATYCDSWVPPINGECEKCQTDNVSRNTTSSAFKPCTEYKCHSIGKNCIYVEDAFSGKGECKTIPKEAKGRPLKVNISNINIIDDFVTFNDKTYSGYKYKTIIKPKDKIRVIIQTSKPAVCKTTIDPTEDYYKSLRFYSSTELPSDFNMTKHFLDLKYNINPAFSILADTSQLGSLLSIVDPMSQNINVDSSTLSSIISDYLNGKVYSFIQCVDFEGQQNTEKFISYNFDLSDKTPPRITMHHPYNDIYNSIPNPIEFEISVNDEQEKVLCIIKTKNLMNNVSDVVSSENIITGAPYKIYKEFDKNTIYNWNVVCNDGLNTAYSDNMTFIVK